MTREQIIEQFLKRIKPNDLVISSNGKISRELYELRLKKGEPTNDFYMLGSMGCAVSIGLGVALNTKKQVFVITGDGALLMKLGSLATVAKYRLPNLHIIVLNNNCHDTTGGQPTNFKEVRPFVEEHCEVIDVERGTRDDLGRVNMTPEQIRDAFMAKVRS
jgi:phosphonopyruvate decarboxylase